MLLSAFLLFQVQLVMGKFVLPRFGGGASVWSTSLLVFQFLLLAGYGYAAWISKRWAPRQQARVHLVLLGASAIVIAVATSLWHSPLLPSAAWIRGGGSNPVWQIGTLLIMAVGFQCVLLSATSPLLQSWMSGGTGSNPYRLYALSNLGSMLGLLSYPVLVERVLTLSSQAWVWTLGYAGFLLGVGACAFFKMREVEGAKEPVPREEKRGREPHPWGLWLAFAACSSMMLLATTNLICQQVAAIPLLWVLPLSLYLLSFIICFDHARWYVRGIFLAAYVVLALWSLNALPRYSVIEVVPLVALFCSTMFAVCMVCHGELFRLRPRAQYLTSFYLSVSAGGVLGSAFVALIAPQIFDRFWEYQIALLGCGVLAVIAIARDRSSFVHQWKLGWLLLGACALGVLITAWSFTSELRQFEGEGSDVVWRSRNFFGMKTVFGMPEGKFLVHGHVLHGMQNADANKMQEPTTYYVRQSGVGLLLENYPRPATGQGLRIGVIGMGAGTLATYAQKGDYYRFYELDPSIAELSLGSKPVFTFVQSSNAVMDVVLGDARLQMQEELDAGNPQRFDVLVVDAFSGDAIPVHLLTREAMQIYLRQLRGPESVVAFHVSNTAINLRPVVEALTRDAGLRSIEIETNQGEHPLWVLASREATNLELPAIAAAGKPLTVARPVAPWTDEFSSIFELFLAGEAKPYAKSESN
jgi:hypothetical protein